MKADLLPTAHGCNSRPFRYSQQPAAPFTARRPIAIGPASSIPSWMVGIDSSLYLRPHAHTGPLKPSSALLNAAIRAALRCTKRPKHHSPWPAFCNASGHYDKAHCQSPSWHTSSYCRQKRKRRPHTLLSPLCFPHHIFCEGRCIVISEVDPTYGPKLVTSVSAVVANPTKAEFHGVRCARL